MGDEVGIGPSEQIEPRGVGLAVPRPPVGRVGPPWNQVKLPGQSRCRMAGDVRYSGAAISNESSHREGWALEHAAARLPASERHMSEIRRRSWVLSTGSVSRMSSSSSFSRLNQLA